MEPAELERFIASVRNADPADASPRHPSEGRGRRMRLGAWKLPERSEATLADVDACRAQLEAIVDAQRAGQVSGAIESVDLLILVQALASAWFAASPALHGLADQDPTSPERLAARRATVATAVRALTAAAAVVETFTSTDRSGPAEPVGLSELRFRPRSSGTGP